MFTIETFTFYSTTNNKLIGNTTLRAETSPEQIFAKISSVKFDDLSIQKTRLH